MKIIHRAIRLKHYNSSIEMWSKVAEKIGIKIEVFHRGETNYLFYVEVEVAIFCEGDDDKIAEFENII